MNNHPPFGGIGAIRSEEWMEKARYYVLLQKQDRLDEEIRAWNEKHAQQAMERTGLRGAR